MTKRNKKTQSGRLRIVAGKWRSRLLGIADVEGLRPTAERIRETLFNWLAARVHGSRCLDLCAGTGALGFEALSRGAAKAVFVEKSARAAAELRRSIATLDADGATLVHADAKDFLLKADLPPFDIVFLDPPFAADMVSELCRLLVSRSLLATDALVYVEFDRNATEPELPAVWTVQKDKTAGGVRYLLASTSSN